jgi:hypothetical protein
MPYEQKETVMDKRLNATPDEPQSFLGRWNRMLKGVEKAAGKKVGKAWLISI